MNITRDQLVDTENDLITKLLLIFNDNKLSYEQSQAILDDLMPYLIERDQKLINYAFSAGRASA